MVEKQHPWIVSAWGYRAKAGGMQGINQARRTTVMDPDQES
jgi:uncharacterized protein YegP (UPF0339 family)